MGHAPFSLTTPLLSPALHDSPVFLAKDVCSLSETLLIGKSKNKAGMDNKPVPLLVFPSATLPPTDIWQYQELSSKSADVTTALAANKLSGVLADHLKAQGIIGQPVFEQATNYAPGVTEYARVQHLVTAVLTKTKYNPQCYHDFIQILELDGIRPDTEAACSLLPKGIVMPWIGGYKIYPIRGQS